MFNSTSELYYIPKPPYLHKRLNREPSGIFKKGLIRSLSEIKICSVTGVSMENGIFNRTAAQSYPFVSS